MKQEVQFLAELNGKSLTDRHLAPFILDTEHANLSLDFKKEVNPAIKNLLKLNFSFVITQNQTANQILGQVEKSAGNRIALQVLGRAKKEAEEEFKKAIKNLIELYGKNGQLKKKKRK
jgi:predicted HAD superfamily phosphohydrolase YqeG